MALFASAQDPAAATAGCAAGPDLGSCCMARSQMVGMALPCSNLSQMVPVVLPPLFGASGFPFPAFFSPLFAPFAGGAPVFFYPPIAGVEAAFGRCPQPSSTAEAPSESSASTGSPTRDARLKPAGKNYGLQQQGLLHHFAPLHRGVTGSASRTSLESCSGDRSATPALAQAVSSDGVPNSTRESETDLDFGGPSESLPHYVALLGSAGRAALHVSGNSGGAAAQEAAAAADPLPPSAGTSPQRLPEELLLRCVGTDVLEGSSLAAVSHRDGGGSGAARHDSLPSLPRASRAGVAWGGSDLEEGAGASAPASGRVPLLCRSGALMWVDARRYGAILRRRRQRAERQLQQGALAVTGVAFNRKPLRCVSRSSLALLCAQAQTRARLLQSTGAGAGATAATAVAATAASSCSDESEAEVNIRAVDTEVASDRSCVEAQMQPLSGGQPLLLPLPALLGPDEILAAIAGAAASAQAAAEADAKRAALEAELLAVLAEETGALASFDESAEEDEVVEARGVVQHPRVL